MATIIERLKYYGDAALRRETPIHTWFLSAADHEEFKRAWQELPVAAPTEDDLRKLGGDERPRYNNVPITRTHRERSYGRAILSKNSSNKEPRYLLPTELGCSVEF